MEATAETRTESAAVDRFLWPFDLDADLPPADAHLARYFGAEPEPEAEAPEAEAPEAAEDVPTTVGSSALEAGEGADDGSEQSHGDDQG